MRYRLRPRPALAQMARIGGAAALASLVLQLVGADRWPAAAALPLALPPPAAAALLAAAAALSVLAGRRRLALIWLAAGATAGCIALALDFQRGLCAAPAPGSLRLVVWNVGHRWSPAMAAAVRDLEPDLAVLVEGDAVGGERWPLSLEGLDLCDPGWGLLVFSRAPVVRCEASSPGPGARTVLAELADPDWPRVLAVDVHADLLAPRRAAIAGIASLAAAAPPAVVVGDFNTPRRAASFASLAATHASAWSTAGRGWAPTWPRPLPVIDLDQAWLPAPYEATCARVVPAPGSDHLPLVVDLGRRPAQSM